MIEAPPYSSTARSGAIAQGAEPYEAEIRCGRACLDGGLPDSARADGLMPLAAHRAAYQITLAKGGRLAGAGFGERADRL